MNKNTSILLIAVVAGIMLVGALAVTTTTNAAFAYTNTNTNNGGNAGNGVIHPGHNACDNAGPSEHNQNCQ